MDAVALERATSMVTKPPLPGSSSGVTCVASPSTSNAKRSPGGAGHNRLTRGDFKEIVQYRGIDLTGAYKGLSGSIEYLEVLHDFDGSDPTTLSVPFKANGWSAQLAYVLPIKLPPFKRGRFEIGARVEEIDRNDTFPIPTAGDPNQSVTAATGVVTYYLREHGMKVALAFEHFTEKEDLTVGLQNATYDNDQVILQLTYRLD